MTTPKGKLWMELDTGSDGSIVIGNHNAELFSMKADDPSPQRFQGEWLAGYRWRRLTRVPCPL